MPKKKTDTSGMKDMFAVAKFDSLEERRKYIDAETAKLRKELASLRTDVEENPNDIEARNDYNSVRNEIEKNEEISKNLCKQIQELKNTYNL